MGNKMRSRRCLWVWGGLALVMFVIAGNFGFLAGLKLVGAFALLGLIPRIYRLEGQSSSESVTSLLFNFIPAMLLLFPVCLWACASEFWDGWEIVRSPLRLILTVLASIILFVGLLMFLCFTAFTVRIVRVRANKWGVKWRRTLVWVRGIDETPARFLWLSNEQGLLIANAREHSWVLEHISLLSDLGARRLNWDESHEWLESLWREQSVDAVNMLTVKTEENLQELARALTPAQLFWAEVLPCIGDFPNSQYRWAMNFLKYKMPEHERMKFYKMNLERALAQCEISPMYQALALDIRQRLQSIATAP